MNNDLFGSTQKLVATGNHEVDYKQLSAPFEEKEARGRTFCRGCGTYLELTDEGVKQLNQMTAVKNGMAGKGEYFITQSCIGCHPDDAVNDPEVVHIQ